MFAKYISNRIIVSFVHAELWYKTFIWEFYQILGGLELGETCTYAQQCSGTKHATQCLYDHESDTKMCSCMKDYVASGSKCICGMFMLKTFCIFNYFK